MRLHHPPKGHDVPFSQRQRSDRFWDLYRLRQLASELHPHASNAHNYHVYHDDLIHLGTKIIEEGNSPG